MKTMMDIRYGEDQAQCLDVYLPEGNSFPVVVYFHGGGLEAGDKTDQRIVFEYLLQKGIAVVSANYRMYPAAHYPDFLHDAASAVAWVFGHMKNYGQVEGVYIGGSSAGGYISQMLCFDPSYLAAHGIKPMDVAGYIHDAGQPTCHFNVLRERGLDTRRVIVDESCALYHIAADQEYPPMLIIVSDHDMTNRWEQTMLLASTLKHFGYGDQFSLKIMSGTHCAYVGQVDEQGNSIFGQLICEFLRK